MKDYLKHACPCCGGKVYVYNKGFHCEQCNFHIPGFICNRHISKEEAEKILAGKKVILDGFSTSEEKIFSSIPVIEGETVRLDNTIALCHKNPEFQGRIVVGKRFFKCENADRCFASCLFRGKYHLRRTIDGHMITFDDIRVLLHYGDVVLDTYSKSGDMSMRRINNPLGGGFFLYYYKSFDTERGLRLVIIKSRTLMLFKVRLSQFVVNFLPPL